MLRQFAKQLLEAMNRIWMQKGLRLFDGNDEYAWPLRTR
jgi:hypothetical protein